MPHDLIIRLTRTSPTHHRFAYVKPDGTGDVTELETRSCLYHDLLHFALETEVGLRRSFYGHLATGESYADLSAPSPDPTFSDEIGVTERVVGGLTGALKANIAPEAFIEAMRNLFDAHGQSLPTWLVPDLVPRIHERMRRLTGEWNATPFGQSMELRFPLA